MGEVHTCVMLPARTWSIYIGCLTSSIWILEFLFVRSVPTTIADIMTNLSVAREKCNRLLFQFDWVFHRNHFDLKQPSSPETTPEMSIRSAIARDAGGNRELDQGRIQMTTSDDPRTPTVLWPGCNPEQNWLRYQRHDPTEESTPVAPCGCAHVQILQEMTPSDASVPHERSIARRVGCATVCGHADRKLQLDRLPS